MRCTRYIIEYIIDFFVVHGRPDISLVDDKCAINSNLVTLHLVMILSDVRLCLEFLFGKIIGNFASFDNSSAFRTLEWDRKITLSSIGLNGSRELLFRIDYLGLSSPTSSPKIRFCTVCL